MTIERVKVLKQHGEIAQVEVKYASGRFRFFKGNETLPMTIARFILLDAQKCETRYFDGQVSVDAYTI